METALLELCLVCAVSSYNLQNAVNVALHKSANQSSSHNAFKHRGSAAVDGKTPDSERNSVFKTCIHTSEDPEDTTPWWEVDLGQRYPISYFTVHARPDFRFRMILTTISIDNKTCFTIKEVPANNSLDVRCTQPLTGQKVRLTRNSTSTNFSLNLCEVEVWVCNDGKHGWKCSQSCGHCYNNETCDKVTGRCPNSTCAPGWKGDMCDEICKDGQYGANCRHSCGRCQHNEACNKTSGKCRTACSPGWRGDRCDAESAPENMGVNSTFIGVASAVVIIILITAAVIAFFLFNRRLIRQKPAHSDCPPAPHNAVENRTPEVHYVNTMARNTCMMPASAGETVSVITDVYATVKPRETLRPQAHPEPKLNDKRKAEPLLQASDIYVNIKTNSLLTKPRWTEEMVVVDLPNPEGGTQNRKGAEAGSQGPEPVDARSPDSEENLYACVSKTVPPKSLLLLRTIKADMEKNFRLLATDDEFSKLLSGLLYNCKIASRKENRRKNRFNSILPYDSTRVVLEKMHGDEASDYINASYIRGYKTDKKYIAAQGPKENTADDFWRMVWQENVSQIIMLTNLVEKGKSKCFEYWPAKGESCVYGEIEVKCSQEQHRAHFVVRSLHLRPRNVTKFRQVDQLQFTSWMDHEVPSATPLIDFWKFAKSHPSACTSAPLVVHCSAGIGRTGTYIGLDIVMEQAKQANILNILDVVRRMREDRCSMVQNKQQYSFLHEAVLEACSCLRSRLHETQFDMFFSDPVTRSSATAAIDSEFENLQLMKDHLTDPSYTTATLPENRPKNRNMNALPSDNHLAYLATHARGRNNYISAVFAPTLFNARGSILTQLPLADTMQDLWRLVESFEVSTIVSLARVDCFEKDLSPYWPMTEGETMEAGNYTLTLLTKSVLGSTLHNYTINWERKRAVGELRLLHFTDWQQELPDNTDELVRLLQVMQRALLENKKNPFIIQCIDGAARSGLFCVLCNVISQMTCDHVVDIYTKVREVQSVRPQVVTSLEQYRFCYELVQRFRNMQCIYANR